MNMTGRFRTCWRVSLVAVAAVMLAGCEAMYQSYDFSERVTTGMPLQVQGQDVWVTSIPEGADVYIHAYDAEAIPSHNADPDVYRGKTPSEPVIGSGSYWIELALTRGV